MASSVESNLATLSGVRIFFGHQSVGANIVEGLRTMLESHRGALTIIELADAAGQRVSPDEHHRDRTSEKAAGAATSPSGALVHAKIGRNQDPSSKCDDFRRIIDTGLAGPVDIALFKLCYVDINPRTDVEALAASYTGCLDELAKRHPATIFVPVTSPLRQTPNGPGAWVRELLGRTNHAKVANAKRHEFNVILRGRYAGRPLFDLAASEATAPDGHRETFMLAGRAAESLRAAYTDDGGHLNEAGRAAAAIDLVHALATAARLGPQLTQHR
jgi:hypothetical protein